jgi:L-alanine-DL-glutamate epimerase-like enolase superfamily enzyme
MGRAGTKVASVEGRVVDIPLEKPTGVKNVYFERTHFALFRVRDDDGVEGFSGLWAFRQDLPDLFVSVTEYMARQVVGRSLERTGEVSDVLEAASGFIGRTGLAVFGISALRMAIEDIVCKRMDVSLAELLGKVRTHIPAYKTGLFLSTTEEELVSAAQKANAEGFKALKMWVGSADLQEDLDRIRIVKEALAPGTKLMLDASQAWNLPEATRALDPLAEFEPVWIEEPLPYRDVVALASLARRSRVPLCSGESIYLPESFRDLLEAGIQYLEPDLERLGGVRQWMEVVAMAAPYGAVVVPHVYASVALQLAAATHQRETWIEYVPWWQTIFATPLPVVDGMVEVPNLPGIGFDLDHDVVDDLARGDWRLLAKA